MKSMRKISLLKVLSCILALWFSSVGLASADIVINILVVNGTDSPKEKDVYQHLPKELHREDILDTAGLDLDFDVTKGRYVVHGKTKLAAKDSFTYRVKVRDVWQIDQEEVEEIRKQIESNAALVDNTEYAETAAIKKKSLLQRLDFIVTEQKKYADNATKRIDSHRTYAKELNDIRGNALSVKYWRAELPVATEENTFKLILEARNPSSDKPVTKEQKHYLPKEVKPEHIVDYEGFQIRYDAVRGKSYLTREEELQPLEVKRYEVGILDIWEIEQGDIDNLRDISRKTYKLLEPTEYAESAGFLIASIKKHLESIEASQSVEKNINEHIRTYRSNEDRYKKAKKDVEALEELLEAVRESLVRSKLENILQRIRSLSSVADVADAIFQKDADEDKTWKLILIILIVVGAVTIISFIIWTTRSKDVVIEETAENKANKEEVKEGV